MFDFFVCGVLKNSPVPGGDAGWSGADLVVPVGVIVTASLAVGAVYGVDFALVAGVLLGYLTPKSGYRANIHASRTFAR